MRCEWRSTVSSFHGIAQLPFEPIPKYYYVEMTLLSVLRDEALLAALFLFLVGQTACSALSATCFLFEWLRSLFISFCSFRLAFVG